MVDSRKTARSFFWSGLENAGLALISLGGLVLYSRMLSPSDFGLFSVVLSIFELCSLLVTMTFHDALIQRDTIDDSHFDSAFTISIGISAVLVCASWLTATTFERVVHVKGAGAVYTAMSLAYPALAASSTIVARQRRDLDFKALAIRSLGGRAAGLASGLVAAAYGLGVWSLVTQQICTSCVGTIVLWLAADHRPSFRFTPRSTSEILHFGLISTLNLVVSFSAKRLFVLLAGIKIGLTEAGFLNIAFRVVDMLWSILATAVTQVSLPMLTNMRIEGNRLSHAYQRAVGFSCLLLFPCFTGIALIAPELLRLVFGVRWQSASMGVTILALLAVAQTPRLFANPLLTALGRPQDVLLTAGIELVVLLLILSACDVRNYETALKIWVISELSQVPVSIAMLQRTAGYGIKEQFSGVTKPFLATLSMSFFIELARYFLVEDLNDFYRISLIIPIGVATFFGVILLIDRAGTLAFVAFLGKALGLSNSLDTSGKLGK